MRIPALDPPWRDTAAVIAITLATVVICIHFDLNEALYRLTRHGETFQLDELPIALLVLSVGLMWLAWRRYHQARRELQARQIAESRLLDALADNRKLSQEIVRIQEEERKHLARELHDEFGQYLNVIKLDAVSISEHKGFDARLAMEASLAIVKNVDHVHSVLGNMVARLRPVGFDELGLAAAIEHCVDEWRPRLPETQFDLCVRGQFEDLSEPLSLTLFRLVQEGLTNIYKHAHAQRARIVLERIESAPNGKEELHLSVADDGCGMQSVNRGSRFGLSGMRERVEMQGGTFELASAPGCGLHLEARLPVSRSANAQAS
jgi:two-component system, NarL family, sensor histidine kinase UhpB